MQEGPFRKAQWISRYLSGDLTPDEEAEFRQWLDADPANRQLLTELEDEARLEKDLSFLASVDKKSAWEKVAARLDEPAAPPHAPVWLGYFKYAAAILIFGLLSYAAFQLAYSPQGSRPAAVARTVPANDIGPGGYKATLTFADGSIVDLEEMKNGTVREEGGIRVSKQDGQLVYEVLQTSETAEIAYNTIKTPMGGQYHIILPDGSKVWLNSASSLHFPTAFAGNRRNVELTGEGYFEIVKNTAKPFFVQAGKTLVEVLGTHFNVMAYANEGVTRTTLLEGSVKVASGGASRTIVPGQQAVSGDRLAVREVDTDEAVAWKNGYFQFENEDLGTIMRQLKRWYNVDVTAEVPDKHFTAVISRNTSLAQVLKMLEMSGELDFEIEENRITIREKK